MTQPESMKERIERWRRTVDENPESTTARFNLGVALTERGRLEEAEAVYLELLKRKPDMAKAWVNLGGVRMLRWDFDGCLEATRRGVELAPDSPRAHYNHGQACLYKKDARGLVNAMQQVLKLERDNAAAHYYAAVGLLELKELGKAKRHMARALELGHQPEPEFLRALERAQPQGPHAGQGAREN